jgi:NAD(P)-dependent dehydrogenase (short-subunit alcohol dehydrogenase family)
MDLEIKGKTALVTGSTTGIGYAIAEALLAEGVRVYVNGRTKERVDVACQKLQSLYPESDVLRAPFDLSYQEGIKALIDAIPQVDILINNLGIYAHKPFEEITDDEWLCYFETNVLSGIRLSRHYFPKMLKTNWGRIIFISSESGVNIPPEMIHYGVTKTAQLAVARGLAELTKDTQVTVNSVLPGPTASEGVSYFIEDVAKERGISPEVAAKELLQTLRPTSLLGRLASTNEVGKVVAFVCSKHAQAINGAALRVEGGVVRSIV